MTGILFPFSAETLMLLAVCLPLATMILMPLTGKYPNLRECISLVSGLGLFMLVLDMLQMTRKQPITVDVWTFVPELSLSFHIEPLGMVFAFIASFLWIVTTLYAIGYMRGNDEKHQSRFYACFALAISSAMGIALSANLFTTFIFYEAMTLGTLPLVTHAGTPAARKGGMTYLGLLMGTSLAFLLPAILWTYYEAGTLDYIAGGILKYSGLQGLPLGILLLLFAYGIGKAALMPFHRWLPAAMVAPTPVSALLHAVAVVKAGVFLIVKVIFYIFGTDYLLHNMQSNWWSGIWLTYLAGFTIIFASVIALTADNLKRRLAYSTISQLSYIVMAVSIATPYAVLGAILHIAAHAFGKITLFFGAGSIYTATGKKNVSELNGIGRQMPITMACFSIATLSMIGLPPAVGFLSKWYMLKGAFLEEHYFVFFVLIFSTVLTGFYLLPIIYRAFFLRSSEHTRYGEAPWPIILAMLVTAAGCIVLFMFPDFLVDMEFPLLPSNLLHY